MLRVGLDVGVGCRGFGIRLKMIVRLSIALLSKIVSLQSREIVANALRVFYGIVKT